MNQMISHNSVRELGEKPNPPENITRSWFKYFQFDPTKDSPSEIRNVLLVVVTLIAAVTFQAGVNPPGGVWQDDGHGHKAGRAIYASQEPAYDVFMLSNTLAFSSSILVIISLTYTFPFRVEIWVATTSMVVTYASAILAVTPHESLRNRYIWAVAAVPIIIRCFIQFVYNNVIGCLSIYASHLAKLIRISFFHVY